MSEMCALVEAWLSNSREAAAGGLPPGDLVDHVAGCPHCRFALVALVADRIGPLATPLDQECPAVEAELPAFVDYERANGLAAAARAFPDVWWHTLVCPECDELYRALHELAAPPALRLAPQQLRWPAVEVELLLHPAAVRQSFGLNRYLGPSWGEEEDTLIAEQPAELGVLQVSLRHEPPGRVALVVRTRPPASGLAVLALGGICYDAPLDRDGCAIFPGLSEALFSADGEPIKLTIRPL